MVEIVHKNDFKIDIFKQFDIYLFAGFKTIILGSVHPIRFVKYVFSAKIWPMKSSTRIVKYES